MNFQPEHFLPLLERERCWFALLMHIKPHGEGARVRQAVLKQRAWWLRN